MHLENIDAAVAARDPILLRDKEGAECVKGCYRCLLSYYNQPDHELIDRTDRSRAPAAPSDGMQHGRAG